MPGMTTSFHLLPTPRTATSSMVMIWLPRGSSGIEGDGAVELLAFGVAAVVGAGIGLLPHEVDLFAQAGADLFLMRLEVIAQGPAPAAWRAGSRR